MAKAVSCEGLISEHHAWLRDHPGPHFSLVLALLGLVLDTLPSNSYASPHALFHPSLGNVSVGAKLAKSSFCVDYGLSLRAVQSDLAGSRCLLGVN